jgi:hypothetical protein
MNCSWRLKFEMVLQNALRCESNERVPSFKDLDDLEKMLDDAA